MKKKALSSALTGPQRCACGRCAACLDNVRWERIFQEKFGQQEQDYYAAAREPRSAGVSSKALADASIYSCADEGQTLSKAQTPGSNLERFFNYVRKAGYKDKVA